MNVLSTLVLCLYSSVSKLNLSDVTARSQLIPHAQALAHLLSVHPGGPPLLARHPSAPLTTLQDPPVPALCTCGSYALISLLQLKT